MRIIRMGQFDVLLMNLVVKTHLIRRNRVKKDAKKNELSGQKRIIREKDIREKAMQRLIEQIIEQINSLACNVIGFKDFRI